MIKLKFVRVRVLSYDSTQPWANKPSQQRGTMADKLWSARPGTSYEEVWRIWNVFHKNPKMFLSIANKDLKL